MLCFSPSRDRGTKFADFAAKAAKVGSPGYKLLTGKMCWESAIECARTSGAISAAGAADLNNRARGGNADGFAPVGAGGSAQLIATAEQFMSIPAGCFIAFCGDPLSSGGPGTRSLSHVMVSLGNGRAAGSNNAMIDNQPDWHEIQLDTLLTWGTNSAWVTSDPGRTFEIRVVDLDGIDAPRCIIM